MEAIAGEDVDLECIRTYTNDMILVITWTHSDGTLLFNCDPHNPCEINSPIHTFGIKDTFISSTVTIRNVSLFYEDEYDITMSSIGDMETCKINLTVNGNFLKVFN